LATIKCNPNFKYSHSQTLSLEWILVLLSSLIIQVLLIFFIFSILWVLNLLNIYRIIMDSILLLLWISPKLYKSYLILRHYCLIIVLISIVKLNFWVLFNRVLIIRMDLLWFLLLDVLLIIIILLMYLIRFLMKFMKLNRNIWGLLLWSGLVMILIIVFIILLIRNIIPFYISLDWWLILEIISGCNIR
jgi:hypothetical protein